MTGWNVNKYPGKKRKTRLQNLLLGSSCPPHPCRQVGWKDTTNKWGENLENYVRFLQLPPPPPPPLPLTAGQTERVEEATTQSRQLESIEQALYEHNDIQEENYRAPVRHQLGFIHISAGNAHKHTHTQTKKRSVKGALLKLYQIDSWSIRLLAWTLQAAGKVNISRHTFKSTIQDF